ncbi:MAG: hypothetical protein IT355_00535 [Gemmatimonadaceae bacterium]|nr:hypothetical protein [Gemmatimonadaceae bacterium]
MPLSPYLRDRLLARFETMSDERAFQVLDYVEFLESKYSRIEAPTGAAGLLAKLQETVEDGLRAGKVSATSVADTLGFMQKAVGVLSGVAAAGQSVATDLAGAASRAARAASGETPPTPPTSPASGAGEGPAR